MRLRTNPNILNNAQSKLLGQSRLTSDRAKYSQSEHIGQWATPHHLSDVRRGAPSWISDYLAHSDVTIYVLKATHAILCAIAG